MLYRIDVQRFIIIIFYQTENIFKRFAYNTLKNNLQYRDLNKIILIRRLSQDVAIVFEFIKRL